MKPTSLSLDVWLDIINIIKDDKATLKSLALVDHSLRGLALPMLFNTMKLTFPRDYHLPSMDAIHRRVKNIMTSTSCMSAIRRINLENWNPTNLVLLRLGSRDQDIDDRYRRGFRETLHLIATLPGLYRLDCTGCSITSEFLYSVSHLSTLGFLRLSSTTIARDIDPRELAFPALSTLEYNPTPSFNASVFHQFDQLIALCYPIHDLSHIFNMSIQLPRLRKLTLFFPFIPSRNFQEYIHDFLSLTPNLRELHMTGQIQPKIPLILPNSFIPHLSSLTARCDMAKGVAPGRPLERIHIISLSPDEFPETYDVVSRGIKKVVYSGQLNNPERDFSHLACMFPNATALRITALEGCRATHEVPLPSILPIFKLLIQLFQEISNAVLCVLPNFSQLRKCEVFDRMSHPDDLGHYAQFHCPAGRSGDPTYRSHPTLEEVQILSWYRWVWIPEDGWRAVTLHYEPFKWKNNIFIEVCGRLLTASPQIFTHGSNTFVTFETLIRREIFTPGLLYAIITLMIPHVGNNYGKHTRYSFIVTGREGNVFLQYLNDTCYFDSIFGQLLKQFVHPKPTAGLGRSGWILPSLRYV